MLSLAALAALTLPAVADDCGAPPDPPTLPNAATATADDAATCSRADQDYAQDTEGQLICLQLAESDVTAAAERGEMTAKAARAAQTALEDRAAQARGNHSGWNEKYDRWTRAWARAHR